MARIMARRSQSSQAQSSQAQSSQEGESTWSRQSGPAAVAAVLAWYDRNKRALPWRESRDPYRIWLSEIMLQQTVVATAIPYYHRFLERWPSLKHLALASLEDILVAWQGLGYYARARNLHRCARVIHRDYGGCFPQDEATLLTLPGIGLYTAAAIAAIAFGHPAPVIDGNIVRVLSRWLALDVPLPHLKTRLQPIAAGLTPTRRPGDYAQAMMDLGAMVCTPRTPDCRGCPVGTLCLAGHQGIATRFPKRVPAKTKPHRCASVFWLVDNKGRVYLRRRPPRGLLGGMMEFPLGPLVSRSPCDPPPLHPDLPQDIHWPKNIDWHVVPGTVHHVFTHFRLELTVFCGTCDAESAQRLTAPGGHQGRWVFPRDFSTQALPTLMRKVAALATGPLVTGPVKGPVPDPVAGT